MFPTIWNRNRAVSPWRTRYSNLLLTLPGTTQKPMRPPNSSTGIGEDDLLTTCLKYAATSILSVGSGDGSQQLAIAREGHTNICATFYDSKQEVVRKYPHAIAILDELEFRCKYKPLFEVDATRLQDYKGVLGDARFDVIFFTFPHTGVPNNDQASVDSNKALLREFLSSSQHLLARNGQIQLTLKNGVFYEQWGLQSIITEMTSLKYGGGGPIRKELFPGYRHRLTIGMNGSLKEVVDKQGATVHRFRCSSPSSSTSSSSSPINHLTSLHILAMDSVDNNANRPMDQAEINPKDDRICETVQAYFKSPKPSKIPPTVLDIRRAAFTEPLPPVPQLNRVLYGLHKKKWLDQVTSTGRPNKKPRWKMCRDQPSQL